MRIFSTAAQKPLTEHIKEITHSLAPASWRCIVSKLDKNLYIDPHAQRIALSFIEEHYKNFDTYEFAFYWLRSGHVFVLFQGRVSNVCETFDKFLDFTSEGENTAKPAFDLYDMDKQRPLIEEHINAALKDIETLRAQDKNSTQKQRLHEMITPTSLKRDKNTDRNMRAKPLLLIVEDERMTQSFISAIMEPYCNIIMADNVSEARTLYNEYWPNIVFMDIELPDGCGEALTRELCTNDDRAHIVMISASLSKDRAQNCRAAGSKGFIAKPITKDKDRLLSVVHQYNTERRSA